MSSLLSHGPFSRPCADRPSLRSTRLIRLIECDPALVSKSVWVIMTATVPTHTARFRRPLLLSLKTDSVVLLCTVVAGLLPKSSLSHSVSLGVFMSGLCLVCLKRFGFKSRHDLNPKRFRRILVSPV